MLSFLMRLRPFMSYVIKLAIETKSLRHAVCNLFLFTVPFHYQTDLSLRVARFVIPSFCLTIPFVCVCVPRRSRWIPFAMLSARPEDTVTASQPARCTVHRAST